MKKATKEEFEQGYAERSGVTVDYLHRKGERAIPCDCDFSGCLGWQMVNNAVRLGLGEYAANKRN